LVSRINRFVAQVMLPKKGLVYAHCPNSGSMLSCCEPGRRVFLKNNGSLVRKYPFTWELIDMGSSLVGIDTNIPNRLVSEAFRLGVFPGYEDFRIVRREVKTGDSRLDMCVLREDGKGGRLWVEVKNCTLLLGKTAFFPDAKTLRGQRHLRELMRLKKNDESMLVFVIQRQEPEAFSPADFIDPDYGKLLRDAIKEGVKVVAFKCKVKKLCVYITWFPYVYNLIPQFMYVVGSGMFASINPFFLIIQLSQRPQALPSGDGS